MAPPRGNITIRYGSMLYHVPTVEDAAKLTHCLKAKSDHAEDLMSTIGTAAMKLRGIVAKHTGKPCRNMRDAIYHFRWCTSTSNADIIRQLKSLNAAGDLCRHSCPHEVQVMLDKVEEGLKSGVHGIGSTGGGKYSSRDGGAMASGSPVIVKREVDLFATGNQASVESTASSAARNLEIGEVEFGGLDAGGVTTGRTHLPGAHANGYAQPQLHHIGEVVKDATSQTDLSLVGESVLLTRLESKVDALTAMVELATGGLVVIADQTLTKMDIICADSSHSFAAVLGASPAPSPYLADLYCRCYRRAGQRWEAREQAAMYDEDGRRPATSADLQRLIAAKQFRPD